MEFIGRPVSDRDQGWQPVSTLPLLGLPTFMNSPERQDIEQGISCTMQYIIRYGLQRRGGDRSGAGKKDHPHVEQHGQTKNNESRWGRDWRYLEKDHLSLKREKIHDPASQDRKQDEGTEEIEKVFDSLSKSTFGKEGKSQRNQ